MHKRSIAAALFAAVFAFGPAAAAPPVHLANASLYKLVGGAEPVFGYKLSGSGKNTLFMRCDLSTFPVDESKLIQTGGSCGDTRGNAAITVFSLVTAGAGNSKLTVLHTGATAVEPVTGQTFVLPTNTVQAALFSGSPQGHSGFFATSDSSALTSLTAP